MGAGKCARIAGKTMQAINQHEGFFTHSPGCGQVRLPDDTRWMMLRLYKFFCQAEVFFVIDFHTHFLQYVKGCFFAVQYSGSTFANVNGVTGSESFPSERFVAFRNQQIIRFKTCTDIDCINVIN